MGGGKGGTGPGSSDTPTARQRNRGTLTWISPLKEGQLVVIGASRVADQVDGDLEGEQMEH